MNTEPDILLLGRKVLEERRPVRGLDRQKNKVHRSVQAILSYPFPPE